jgi:hypothetical protein
MLEAAIVARDSKKTVNQNLRNIILEIYNGFVQLVEGTYYSTLLKRQIRCNRVGAKLLEWHDCTEQEKLNLKMYLEEKEQKQRTDNPYNVIGKYNELNKAFCLVDFEKEKQRISQSGTVDRRVKHTGKVCRSGWKIPDLLRLAVLRLKIEPPENVNYGSLQVMKNRIEHGAECNIIREVFTKEELSGFNNQELRRVLYWGLKDGGIRKINTMCDTIQAWLDQKGLVEKDAQCGVQSKTKILPGDEKVEKKTQFRPMVEQIQANSSEQLNEIKSCLNENINPKTNWLVARSRKNFVGAVQLVSISNAVIILENLCIKSNYKSRKGVKEGLVIAFHNLLKNKYNNAKLRLRVSRKNISANVLLNFYKKCGFIDDGLDNDYTYLTFSG